MLNKHTDMVIRRLYELVSEVPSSRVQKLPAGEVAVRNIIRQSAVKTSSVSAALSFPGGPWGLMAAIPDIMTVWKIQARMISDIAAVHGKEPLLSREQMVWCLFRQMAAGVVKELVVQQGTQYLVRHSNTKVMHKVLEKVGHHLVKSQGSKLLTRAVPVIGSLSAGALTYYDTCRVGKNAAQLYSGDLILLPAS